MKLLKKFHLGLIFLPIVSLVSVALTIFFFASSLEIVLAQNLSNNIGSVQVFSSSNLLTKLIAESFTKKLDESIIVNEHRPEKIQVHSEPNIKIDLLASKKEGDSWLTWQGKAHYFIESENPQSGIGNMFVFTENNWRTNVDPSLLKPNTLISLKTIKYVNTYKIIEKILVEGNQTPIITKLNVPYMILLVHDTSTGKNYLIKSIFISKVPLEN